jgi:hypothetical protein
MKELAAFLSWVVAVTETLDCSNQRHLYFNCDWNKKTKNFNSMFCMHQGTYTPFAVVSHARKTLRYQPLLQIVQIRMFRRKRALCSQNNLDKFTKKFSQKLFSNEMKVLSSLKTRIYPKWFPNASAVTWWLVLQTRNLANKTEQFWKCDDFSGEIIARYWPNIREQNHRPPGHWQWAE